MLNQEDVIPLLLRHALVHEEQLVDGALEVVNFSRRNRNFKVLNERGPGYLVKQGIGTEKTRTVAHEASVYRVLTSAGTAPRMVELVPNFCLYDVDDCVLILELIDGSVSLMEYHSSHRRFSRSLAATLGKTLATFHRAYPVGEADAEVDGIFANRVPFILSIHSPDLGIYGFTSQAGLELIKVVQQSAQLVEMLAELQREWRVETLIHGDLRWDNCAIVPGVRGQKPGIKLIDWELASAGDPYWDVGAVLGEYLSFWLRSAPLTEQTPPEQFLELALCPLESMQPATLAFWRSYARQMDLDPAESVEGLTRAVKYAAARLIQTAFEQLQNATRLTSHTVFLLQLSQNMLARPREASVQLLGIPLV